MADCQSKEEGGSAVSAINETATKAYVKCSKCGELDTIIDEFVIIRQVPVYVDEKGGLMTNMDDSVSDYPSESEPDKYFCGKCGAESDVLGDIAEVIEL